MFQHRFCNSRFTKTTYKQINFYFKMQNKTCEEYTKILMRHKKKLKQLTSTNCNVTLQVIGSGAPGVAASVLVTTGPTCYLFNCGETIQRLSHEHHCKLAKLDHIFITRPCWKHIGGLPGLLLTLKDTGLNEVHIHCSERIQELISTVKQFITLSQFNIIYPTINESEPYNDPIMQVYYVPLTMSTAVEETLKSTNTKQDQLNVSGKRQIDDENTERDLVRAEKKFKSMVDVICYICDVHPRPAKLILRKCEELGLPQGPLMRVLKEGNDITLDDGRIILSKDVCYPSGPPITFMIIECPTKEYLDSLVNHSAFSKYQNTSERKDEVYCMFHITPEDIFNSAQYQNWIKTFSTNADHIILNKQNTCMGSEAVFKNQYLLNMIHPEIFPLLSEDSLKDSESDEFHRGSTMMTQKLQPHLEKLITTRVRPEPQQYIDLVSEIPNFQDNLTKLKTAIKNKTEELKLDSIPDFPQIVMLGTGSSVPNKVRNTSAILLKINKDSSILLDCGEGTISQLIRFYGNSECRNILRTIKAIYISHMHADHHLGIIGLLEEREKLIKEPLYLFAPHTIEPWLKFYNNQFERISHCYTLINNQDFYLKKPKESLMLHALFSYLNVKNISTIYVQHCKFAYGVAITLMDGTKLVYSGDTIPCRNLIELGQNCDLLIHEATMDDDLEDLAKSKLHSTTSQAINIGKSMNAKFVLLTHFSQRYSKIPILPEHEENVGLAYDNMLIKLPQLPLLPLFYPFLKLMFNEYYKGKKDE